MDTEYLATLESRLDNLSTRLDAAEKALMQIPQINMQADPSRPPGVIVEPAALVVGL